MKDDVISRKAAIDIVDAVWSVTGDKNVAKVWDQIRGLPAAQPKWILCKERMPEYGVQVLTYSELINFNEIEIQSIESHFGLFCWENQHGDLQELNTVTAWMSLPEPYKEGNKCGWLI